MPTSNYAVTRRGARGFGRIRYRAEERQQQSRTDGRRGALCDGPPAGGHAVDRPVSGKTAPTSRGRRSDPRRNLAQRAGPTRPLRGLGRVLRRRAATGALARGARPLDGAAGAGVFRRCDARRHPCRSCRPEPGGQRDAMAQARARRRLGELGGHLPGAAFQRSSYQSARWRPARRSRKLPSLHRISGAVWETSPPHWRCSTIFPNLRR